MKIVHILTRLLKAGSEENTLATCVSQAAAGHEVYVVHGTDYEKSYYESLPQLKFIEIPNLVHPISVASDIGAFRRLSRLLKAMQPDIVHTHQSKAGILGRLAARNARVPIIVNGIHIVPFENVSIFKRAVYITAERFAARFTDLHISVSRGVMKLYIQARVGDPRDHRVVHSGFDLDRFINATPLDWRTIPELSRFTSKPPIILMLAALEPRKRHVEFVRSFPRLLASIPNAQLLFVGAGPIKDAVEAAIKEYGLSESVHILGYRTDPEKLIAVSDVCTLVSEREGLPRVLMQYVAAGKPSVLTDLPGLDEVLENGVNGFLVPKNDIGGAIDHISALLKDPKLHAQISQGALASDLNSWRTATMCRRVLELYHELHEQRRVRDTGRSQNGS